MKNLEAKRDELFKVYDNWTKVARNTSSIARMNVAQAKAKAAYAEICEIDNTLTEL